MVKPRQSLTLLLLLGTLVFLTALPVVAQQGEGYWYTVQPGDSWWSISARTGIPVGVLQAYNPHAIHPNLYLWRGERIWIPTGSVQTAQQGYWYVVQPGDTWFGIAARTGVPVRVLQARNPHAIHPNNWLWRGDKIFIPARVPIPVAPTPAPAPAPTATATPSPTPESAAPPEPAEVPEGTPTAAAAVTPEATVTPTPTPLLGVLCPEPGTNLEQTLRVVLKSVPADAPRIDQWLTDCDLSVEEGPAVAVADANGDGQPDVTLAVRGQREPGGEQKDMLLVFLAALGDYTPVFRVSAPGLITFLAFRDINGDGRVDLAWDVTTCGAHTCYTTVEIYTWDGAQRTFVDFTEGEISMPSAEVQLTDVVPDNGLEVLLHGGVINAIGAGPQRSWAEVWGSQAGSPYRLLSRQYDPSACLYHRVLDGDAALTSGRLDEALSIYQDIIGNPNLKACWLRPDEDLELRSFAWFRLALAYAYAGQPGQVETVVKQAAVAYPQAPYVQALRTWFDAYATSENPVSACQALQPYIERHPILWEMLADYGYANPTFGPANVCPDLGALYTQPEVRCPTTFQAVLNETLTLLNNQPGDLLAVDNYLASCGYISDTYGGLGAQDIDGDGDEDVFLALNRVSPDGTGIGPGGREGVLAALHRKEKEYIVAYQDPSPGQVTLLILEDVNADGHMDVVWEERTCPEVDVGCWVEARVRSWTGEKYESWVQGRAVILEGSVTFEDRGPGSGQEMILQGGTVAQPGMGALKPRTEIWTSDGGAPYALYDVVYEGSACLRYFLHEAEVALLTAPRYGWQRAINRFQRAVSDPDLIPCKQDGTPAEEEMRALRGFARFRLAQTYAYAGDMDQARTLIEAFLAEDPQNTFAPVAQLWWNAYAPDRDMAAACSEVTTYVGEHQEVLSTLGGYGITAPPLTANDVCPVVTPSP